MFSLFCCSRSDENQNANHLKELKFKNVKDVTTIESQLENVQLCEKSVISNYTFQNPVVQSNTRKIILKRAHLFKKVIILFFISILLIFFIIVLFICRMKVILTSESSYVDNDEILTTKIIYYVNNN